MKERVTVSLDKAALAYLDALKKQKGCSRSEAIEILIREIQQRAKEEEWARQAQAFFALEETAEERAEREDWLRMSMETQKHED